MAAGQRRLNTAFDLSLVPLPLHVARGMLAGEALRPEPEPLRPEPVEGRPPAWHPEYPLADSLNAIAMTLASHDAMTGAIDETPGWWIYQIVVDGVVVGDIGFHGPPGADGVVEIGYSVVPAWRGRGVATQACNLILQQAWRDGAEIVVAETDDGNVASQRVLLGNGFRQGLAAPPQDGEGRDPCVFIIKRPGA